MKRIFILMLGFVLTLALNTVTAQDNPKAIASVTLNVRSEMSNTADVLGTISQGQVIEILSIETGWAVIDYFGKPGYVLSEYLQPASGEETSVAALTSDNNEANKSGADIKNENDKTFIKGFSNIGATWTCGFDSFDKGYYGLRIESFDANGLMYHLSIKGSWGVTTPGMYQWRTGFGKGWAVNKWLVVALPVSFMMGEYVKDVKINSKGKISYDTGLSFGLLVSPGLRFKIDKIIIGAQIDLGGVYSNKLGFYKGLEFSLGYKF